MRRFLLISLMMWSLTFQAQTAPPNRETAHELYGFLLRQGPEAFEKKLGKPLHSGDAGENSRYFAYELSKTSDSYLVAVFRELEGHLQAVRIELTGDKGSPEPSHFFNLELGSSEKEILDQLGKPEEVSHEDDANVDLWAWPSRDYSLEVNSEKKLYSFQIVDSLQAPVGAANVKNARLFVEAVNSLVKSASEETLLKLLSGDISCANGKYHMLSDGSAREQLLRSNDGLRSCLRQAAEALTPDALTHADTNIRVYTKATPTSVVKFPASCKTKEIVFRWEEDAWRVYEVELR
jgi:hypothetical protein